MKKAKRILALACVVLLLAMYGCTFLLALFGSDSTFGLLKASLVCTVVFPVLLYAYMLVYRVLKNRGFDNAEAADMADDSPNDTKTGCADVNLPADAVTGSTETDPADTNLPADAVTDSAHTEPADADSVHTEPADADSPWI